MLCRTTNRLFCDVGHLSGAPLLDRLSTMRALELPLLLDVSLSRIEEVGLRAEGDFTADNS